MPASEALSLRRSPRTTLSPPPHEPSKTPKTKQPPFSSSTPTMPRRSPRLTLSPSSPPTQQTLALTLCGQPVVVEEEEEDPEPQPLKIYHPNLKSAKPHKIKLHLLHASSSSAKKALRRSPRLMGASVGLVNGKCGSELLLKLPEKEACKLARKCLDDNDLNVKCLRSRNLRSPSDWASTVSPLQCKRKFDSGQNYDETPVNRETLRRSSRFSGEKAVDSSENEGKRMKLDYGRSSDEASVDRGFPRRSPRFSGDNAGESEDVRSALPSSSMLEKPEKLMKRDSRKSSGIPGKMPENTGLRRRSMGICGETVESPTRKEIIIEFEGKLGNTSEGVVLSSPNSSLAREFGKSQGHSPSLSSEKTVQSSACSELAVKTSGRSEDTPLPLTLSSVMEEIFGKFEEERVLRRSPRGLSSICLVDDYQCDAMKEMPLPSPKKKKKKKKKEKKQEYVAKDRRDKSKVSGSSPSAIDNDKEDLSESKSCFFVGEAVPEEEAHQRWGWRYQLKVI